MSTTVSSERVDVKVIRGVIYKGDGEGDGEGGSNALNSLDLYLPINEAGLSAPLFVYIHGGLWQDRDKADYTHIGCCFAKKGHAVAVINYRMSSMKGGGVVHPTHTHDAADAILFLFQNAHQYGYDQNSIFLCGHSCGAHMIGLILLNSATYVFEKSCGKVVVEGIKGCIAIQGLFDQDAFVVDFPEFTDQMECIFSKDRNNWESPQHLPIDDVAAPASVARVPWLIIHSPNDTWVHVTQATNFRNHLEQIGCNDVDIVLTGIKGAHFEIVEKIGTDDDQTTKLITSFMKRHEK